MATKKINKTVRFKKKTAQGKSVRTRYKNKNKKRLHKKYNGQGSHR